MSAKEPSRDELLERVRDKVRSGLVAFWDSVTEAIARLKGTKKAGRVEIGDFEHPIATIFDLRRVLMDGNSRVIDVGNSETCWTITVRGPDKLGNPLNVTVQLSKDDNQLLEITSFLPSPR